MTSGPGTAEGAAGRAGGRPLRIWVGGLSHETNSYCPGMTSLDDFTVFGGELLVPLARSLPTYLGGMVVAEEDLGATVIGGYFAYGTRSGMITAETYQTLKHLFIASGQAAAPVDGVALELDVAMEALGPRCTWSETLT